MKAKLLKSASTVVREILESVPQTRDDDDILYALTCQRLNAVFCSSSTMSDFFRGRKNNNLPSYETVSRIRRKIQENCPLLRASDDVEAARMLEEEFFKEWSKKNEV